jgi:hypothetical protein
VLLEAKVLGRNTICPLPDGALAASYQMPMELFGRVLGADIRKRGSPRQSISAETVRIQKSMLML